MVRAAATLMVGLLAACTAPKDGPLLTNGEAATIKTAADEALRRASKGHSPPLVVVVRVVDRYGFRTTVPALTFTWAPQELARINWKGIDGSRLLDLADVTVNGREGVRALSVWCFTRGHARNLTPQLCGTKYEPAVAAFMKRAVT